MSKAASASASSSPEGGLVGTLGVVVLAVCLGFGFAFLPRLFRGASSGMVGKPGPDFSLDVVANSLAPANAKKLGLAELRGHPVILDFWATWCGPCQAQSPILDGVAHRYADRGVVVVGIDTNDAPGSAARWASAHGITYPILFDAEQDAARQYGVESLPTIVVLNREGKVHAVRVGFTDQGEIEGLLRQVL